MKALVLGDVIDDIIVRPRGPIRLDDDTDAEILASPGGSAANTAAWFAEAGMSVVFLGRAGAADVERVSVDLRRSGVEARIIADHELPTGAIVVIVEGAHRSMLTQRGANALLSPDDADDVSGFDVVHLTGYTLLDRSIEGRAASFRRLIDRVHAAGGRVSGTPGSVATIEELGAASLLEATSGVDVMVANAAEAALLTGVSDVERAVVSLAERYPVVAVTDGERGAVVAYGRDVARVEPVAAQAVDPTGAGDAFCAEFVAGVVHGDDPVTAAQRAVGRAAKAVGIVGARPR